MKYFRMSYEEVVFNRSYLNILLLNRSIPSTKLPEDNREENNDDLPLRTRSVKKKQKQFRYEGELFASLM